MKARESMLLRYIELKTGHAHSGPAWIARVQVSRSGRTVYFAGKALKRATGGGIVGNHFDLETREEYWISGVKKDGTDRHWTGSGEISVERSAVQEYLQIVGGKELDKTRFVVIDDLPPTDVERLSLLENENVDAKRCRDRHHNA